MFAAQEKEKWVDLASLRSEFRGLVGSPGNLVVLGSLGGVRSVSPLRIPDRTLPLHVKGYCVRPRDKTLTITSTASSETWVQGSVFATRRVRDYPLLLMSPLFLRVRLSLWCWRRLRWSGWIFTPQTSDCGLTR